MPAEVQLPPHVKAVSLPEQKKFNDLDFPLVLSPTEGGDFSSYQELVDWVKQNKPSLEALVEKHGAVFFRGFPLPTASEFDAVISAFGYPDLPYVGGAAPRTNVVGRVFTANEAPAHLSIPFHHEMAQVPEYPVRLFFFCASPPQQGGETPLLLSNQVYERMKTEHPEFVENLKTKGLLYTRILGKGDDNTSAIGRGWQSTFLTTDQQEAEKKAAKLGMTLEWLPTGDVKTVSGPLPALKADPTSGKMAWFNSMTAAYTGWEDSLNVAREAVKFGDGTPLPEKAVMRCVEIMEEVAVDIPWQPSDFVLINNHTVQHARRSFGGSRRILASLVKSV